MATTYTWQISGLKAKVQDEETGLENVIETVHWRYQAEDADGNVADVYGSVGLESPDAESFIAHDALTRADVEGWLEAKLDVEALKEGLDAQLEAQKNPTHVSVDLVS